MNPTSHRAVTLAAVECLADLEPRNGSTRKRFIISGTDISLPSKKKILALANSQTDGHAPEYNGKKYKEYDFRNEMSYIDINGAGTATDDALDDPHHDKWFESPDKCEKSGIGSSFAAYNHFIDIGKGKGTYNDTTDTPITRVPVLSMNMKRCMMQFRISQAMDSSMALILS